jgi:exodeoxyribonuclease V gamma subunit
MEHNLIFLQSTSLGGRGNTPGLLDLLLLHTQTNAATDLFTQIKIVVPNQAVAAWLKDQIALAQGVSANFDCVVLLGPIIEQVYLSFNPEAIMADFTQVKFYLYEILINQRISVRGSDEINHYLYPDGVTLDKARAFVLASQLEAIFQEYVYLRTEEMLQLDRFASKFKPWQVYLWQQLQQRLGTHKTFLDIYAFFNQCDVASLATQLPKRLFIFGLTSVYPSQLKILKQLARVIEVYWYYLPSSLEYYGDLLSAKAKAKLEQRLLRKPDLSLEDLFLTDGNPLLANLGQQSREFIELLKAHDIEIYEFAVSTPELATKPSILQQLQQEIRNLVYRVRPELRLNPNPTYFADPLQLAPAESSAIYDLPSQQVSIKFNACHNKMREAQVLFNEIVEVLAKNPDTLLSDIVVAAPNIDDYAPYLRAVFDNEQVMHSDGSTRQIRLNITGTKPMAQQKLLASLVMFINAPYRLNASYFLELLMQDPIRTSLELSASDLSWVRRWLVDNKTYWGYDEADYAKHGYQDYPVHSFKQFLANLVLGSSLSHQLFWDNQLLPLYNLPNCQPIVPYDNLEHSQIALANKVIVLIEVLSQWRSWLYQADEDYQEFSMAKLRVELTNLQPLLFRDEDQLLILNDLLAFMDGASDEVMINLPILTQLINDYSQAVSTRFNFNGAITCAPLQLVRNLPYQFVFILGMNFGEFPQRYHPNRLSLLAEDWYLADRNYHNEDKQALLDILLATQQQITFSYLGRKETDNSLIKPSPVLSLVLTTLGHSFKDFWQAQECALMEFDFKNLVVMHSLHPFYRNNAANYSQIWQQVAKITSDKLIDCRWDYSQPPPIVLTNEEQAEWYQLECARLVRTFSYPNAMLYEVLGLTSMRQEPELLDCEAFSAFSRERMRELLPHFNTYPNHANPEELYTYLQACGAVGYRELGKLQFERYYQAYQRYWAHTNFPKVTITAEFCLNSSDGNSHKLQFADSISVDSGRLIVYENFVRLTEKSLPKHLENVNYALLIRGLIWSALIHGSSWQAQPALQINEVALRLINLSGETHDLVIKPNNPELTLSTILRYYLRSLTTPVLIHQQAIKDYAKAYAQELALSGNHELAHTEAYTRARESYSATWENFGREIIDSDPIWQQVSDDYFTQGTQLNGLNDIVQIGRLLATLRKV